MLVVCCVVFVRPECHSARYQTRPGLKRLVCHPKYLTQHGVLGASTWGSRWRIQRTRFSTCGRGSVRVCTASRYRLAGMHPTSRSRSRLRRTERRASYLPPRGLSAAPTVRRAQPHTCVVHEGTDRCMLSSASLLRGTCMLRSLRQSQQG